MAIAVRNVLFSSMMFWFLITVVGVFFVANLRKNLNFGIDLVGGTYITLEVQMKSVIENELMDRTDLIIKDLETEGLAIPVQRKFDGQVLVLVFEDVQAATAAEIAPAFRLQKLAVTKEGSTVRCELSAEEIERLTKSAVESNIVVLRTRVDQFGVGEVTVAPQGEKNIVVELPNVQDVQRAKAMIGTSALLEFKIVQDAAGSKEELLAKYGGTLPDDLIAVLGREARGAAWYAVPRFTEVTGRLLKDAHVNFMGGRTGTETTVAFEFSNVGGEKFYELTGSCIGRQLAIVLDGVVITAPTVQTRLRNSGEITGNFTDESAQELVSLLKSGAFVAPVSFEEDRTIGPSLGAESVRQGLISCLVGLGLLFLFSIIFYKTAGVFAFVVLIYNLLLILFALSWLGATLTLPGIAGMVLTVGMAIDSSILIYERIREELAHGATLRAAVNAGFAGATVVILDANITTFLVAAVLYWLGAGAIQGFAITMIIGIIATLVTGLLLLRSIFNFVIDVLGVQKLSI